ncbi:MAG TPA: alternative ribosome rescue aminoacyl-tRNA hydrolase ArfB [Gemmatimonadaceae bacterium]|nr:alternative ribosome rescue aminoacyl-tRNA hydrolase ArfB [Gemmatimonadaceae bacterium]
MVRDTTTEAIDAGPRLSIPANELEVRATRSGGPGGQHVNTSSTRVEVTWRLTTSRVITDEERERIVRTLAGRLDADGNLRVVASDTRSQRQNRVLAAQRLGRLVARALAVPRPRRKTKPSRSAVEQRLTDKHRQSERKTARRRPERDA